jgi:hypothetical protein
MALYQKSANRTLLLESLKDKKTKNPVKKQSQTNNNPETPLLNKLAFVSFLISKFMMMATGITMFVARDISIYFLVLYGSFIFLTIGLSIYQMYFVKQVPSKKEYLKLKSKFEAMQKIYG